MMCERFSLAADLDEVRDHFKVQRVMYYYKNRYNISPTQHTPIILQQDGERCWMSSVGVYSLLGKGCSECQFDDCA